MRREKENGLMIEDGGIGKMEGNFKQEPNKETNSQIAEGGNLYEKGT